MKELVITRTAAKEIIKIWKYIADDSLDAADKVCGEIEVAMRQLCERPAMGHERPDVKNKSYRFWGVYSFMIAYRVKGRKLYISRVIHGARNFKPLFRKPKRNH